MNKKFHIIVLLFILGMFAVPSVGYACGAKSVKTEKTCCSEKTSNKKETKSCCDSTSADSEDNSCKGKCGHSNCTSVSSVGFSLFVYNEIEFTNNNFDFSTNESKFYLSENLLSDGFPSMWLIPKIG
jgi:cytoskeletal protein RodZ